MQLSKARSVLYGAVIVPLAMLVSGAVLGQGYPSHPIRLVVPFSAGAGENWKQQNDQQKPDITAISRHPRRLSRHIV